MRAAGQSYLHRAVSLKLCLHCSCLCISANSHADSHNNGMLLRAAPEVISAKTSYNGQKADIWSCGVMLYVMLFCEYPFERPEDDADKYVPHCCMLPRLRNWIPKRCKQMGLRCFSPAATSCIFYKPASCPQLACWHAHAIARQYMGSMWASMCCRYGFQKVLERILRVDYHIPKYPRVSSECKDLITRILVADPDKRLTIPQIQRHPWYTKGLPPNVIKMNEDCLRLQPHNHPGYQTVAEIKVLSYTACMTSCGQQMPAGSCFAHSYAPEPGDGEYNWACCACWRLHTCILIYWSTVIWRALQLRFNAYVTCCRKLYARPLD